MRSTIISELLKEQRKALQVLSCMFGFNFQADFGVTEINGKTTVNQIVKAATNDGYKLFNDKLVILIRDTAGNQYEQRYHIVKIDKSSRIEIDYRIPSWKIRPTELETFWRKSDFEEMRKKTTAQTLIFWQNKTLLKTKSDKKPELMGRFITTDDHAFGKCYQSDRKTWFYHKIDILALDDKSDKNNRFEYRINQRTQNKLDVIDKSGYLVDAYRANLYQRFKKYKAAKDKEKVLQIDMTSRVDELKELAKNAKQAILTLFEQAETSVELRHVSALIDRWDMLSSIYSYVDDFAKQAENKIFASVENYNRDYNNIKNDIKTLQDKIKAGFDE